MKNLFLNAQIMMMGVVATSIYSCTSSNSSEKASNTTHIAGQTVSSSYSEPVKEELAKMGEEIFNTKCVSCHQMDSRIVGPPLRGVTTKRTYQWLMKMMENPEEWVKADAVAKQIYEEYNEMPMMIPGGTTEEERKAIIDYLRKEDQKFSETAMISD